MSQINLQKTATFEIPPQNARGYGFDSFGNAVIIKEDGTLIPIISGNSSDFMNIISNRGVGLEADIPTDPVLNDVYASTDTLKWFKYIEDSNWLSKEITQGQFITDSVNTILYQRQDDELKNMISMTPEFTNIKIGNGVLRYNSALDCLEIAYDNGTILQLGRENTTLVYCETDIPNGTPVYYEGVGSKGIGFPTTPIAKIASADNIATAMVKGTTTVDGVAGEYCIITCAGSVTKEGHGFTTGSQLYLNTGSGGFTTTPPSNPNITVLLGLVLDADNLFVCIPIINPINQSGTNINSQLFLSDIDSDIPGYNTLARNLDNAETTKTITATSATSPATGEKYLSYELGITTLPAGVFLGHTSCKVDSNVGTTTLTVDVSIYHINGTKTLLNSVTSLDLNMTTETPVEFSAPYSQTNTVETDRLLVEVYLTTTSATSKTFTYYVGNGRATYITIPLPISHTDLINKNTDPNFLHVTSSQINAFGNKVDGPTSATDNAIARFDGVTGKLVQNSGAYIDDSGNVGIGITNPSSKLHVVGNMTISGTVDGRDVSADGLKLDTTVVGPASSINNSIPVFADSTGKLLKDTTGVSIVGGNFVMANADSVISTNTTDGSDNKRLLICGGGYGGIHRGSYIEACGNEYTGAEGDMRIFAGDSSIGNIRFYTGSSSERMQITKGGNLGIGSGALGAALGKVDISSGGLSLVIGADSNADTRTNTTVKYGRISSAHYTNAEEPISVINCAAEPTQNRVWIGGGSSNQNAATVIQFYTAANNTTVAGTERMTITNGGNVGIANNNPTERLHVIGNTLASGDSASATKTIGGKVRMEYDTATDTLEFNFI